MNPTAIQQAKNKLRRAEKALQDFEAATNYDEAETAWADFLQAVGTIYSKLEQGAKTNGKSQAWFGYKKKERRDDQLLRYLHFARNSEEHGVEFVVERNTGSGANLKFGQRAVLPGQLLDDKGNVLADKLKIAIAGPGIKLIRAHDRRFNEWCDPPSAHLDKKIDFGGLFPLEIGTLALTYLRGMVTEAEALPSKAIAR